MSTSRALPISIESFYLLFQSSRGQTEPFRHSKCHVTAAQKFIILLQSPIFLLPFHQINQIVGVEQVEVEILVIFRCYRQHSMLNTRKIFSIHTKRKKNIRKNGKKRKVEAIKIYFQFSATVKRRICRIKSAIRNAELRASTREDVDKFLCLCWRGFSKNSKKIIIGTRLDK